MTNLFAGHPEQKKWQAMVSAAKLGAISVGYDLKRVPGRGLSNVWEATKDGKTLRASIRTTRDRWLAYPPLNDGKNWKTLDGADMVIAAVVNSKEDPEFVEVYIFPGDEVRKRFNAAYAARANDGQVQKNGFGLWINLDKDTRGIASSVGSGLVADYPMIASYGIGDLLAAKADESIPAQVDDELPADIDVGAASAADPETIAEVMAWARQHVARIAGVGLGAVRLDLKLEY